MYSIPVYGLKLVRERTARYAAPKAECPDTAARIARALIADASTETMLAIFVDASNVPVGTHVVAIGGMTRMSFDGRDLFKAAIVANARAIILAHNHPSGDATPSVEDWICTEKARRAGEVLGIAILDHIVVARGGSFTSMSRDPRWTAQP